MKKDITIKNRKSLFVFRKQQDTHASKSGGTVHPTTTTGNTSFTTSFGCFADK